MDKLKLLFYLFALLILNACINEKQDKTAALTGVWTNIYDPTNRIEFTANGEFKRVIDDKNLYNPDAVHFEENADGNWEEHKYGTLKIDLCQGLGDSIYYTLIGSLNDKIYSHGIFILSDDQLLEISYKTLPGITSHIDELCIYQKDINTIKIDTPTRTEKIIVPQGFKGRIYISYDQADGETIQLDADGNPLLKVPPNGLLKTKLKEDPLVLARQTYEFYEMDPLSGKLSRLMDFQYGDLRMIHKGAQGRDFNRNNTASFVYGFNQVGRGELEETVFGEQLNGNVLCVEISTISERL